MAIHRWINSVNAGRIRTVMSNVETRPLIFLLLLFFVLAPCQALCQPPVVRIGVLAKRGAAVCLRRWTPLAGYLTGKIPGERFAIVPLSFDDVIPAVAKDEIDFALVNPAYYVRLEYRYGAERLATLRKFGTDGGIETTFGGVVFCRKDRKGIPSFNRLKDCVFAAPDKRAFGAWLAVRRELKEMGINPRRDFKGLIFTGTHDAVVYAVRDGKADVGAVRTGVFESMAKEGRIHLDVFRILHRTRRYPEWAFARLRHTPDTLARAVAAALLEMPSNDSAARQSRTAGWDIPANYRSVHACLRALRVAPYANIGKITIKQIARQYWPLILAIACSFLLLTGGGLVILRYARVVRHHRNTLQQEVVKHRQTEALLKVNERRFRDIVSAMGDWVWETDEKGRYAYCSESIRDVLGYTAEEVLGKDPFEFMPKKEAERIGRIFKGLVRKKAPLINLENWNRTKDGKRICLLTNGVPILDETGRFRGYRGVDKDITEQKASERKLNRLYRCLRDLGADYDRNIEIIIAAAGEILGASCTFYHQLEGEETLRTVAAWHAPAGFGINPGVGSVYASVISRGTGTALVVADLQASSYALAEPAIKKQGYQIYIGQQITVGGEPAGVLCAFFTEAARPGAYPIDLLGILVEITAAEEARRLARQDLQERESFLTTLIESTPDAIVVLSPERRIIEMNQAFCGMFDLSREIAMGQSILCVHSSRESMERFGETAYPHIEREGFWRGEWVFKRRDGFLFPAETVTSAIRGEGGEAKGYVAVIRDISERKKARTALEEAHARLDQIVSAIHSIMIGLTPDGIVTLWNSSAERTFGRSVEAVRGKTLETCGLPWEWDRVARGLEACVKHPESIEIEDVRFTNAGGEEGFLGITVNPVRSQEGGFQGMLIFAANITKRKRMESQLLQAQKMESIGQLAAGIAHEINTPTQFVGDNLNFLKEAFEDMGRLTEGYRRLVRQADSEGFAKALLREIEAVSEEVDADYLEEEIPKALQQSLDGVKRVATIVKAMKEFSHPGVSEKVMVDLNKAIETTIIVTKNAWKYVADIRTDLSPDLPPVPCLPDAINQVILNLIVNAAQAIGEKGGEESGEKGIITLTTRDAGPWVEIRVQDTGPGIPEEIRDRIFNPFFTTKEVGRGTGQGLAIAHDTVVNKHGGRLTFETETGRGATFIVHLPKETEKPEA